MGEKPVTGGKRAFMTGNEVVAWAALAAGAEIMYGYPITPQNEIMHYWTRLAPKYGRRFLQTEDEISAGFTTCGGVLSGAKAFTATAGPGNTLMQEAITMAEMMRIPLVQVVQQRGGPSTATVIYSQQEVNMTCYGGNGEGFRIVYSTSSHQELYDYTIKAFNVAWRYRYPTIVLGDGYQAKMREPLYIYDPEEKNIKPQESFPFLGSPGTPGEEREPVHLRNTYNTEEELLDVVAVLAEEYNKVAPDIIEYQAFETEDTEILLVAHGIITRAVQEAVSSLRKEGIKAGHFRPVTLRPFAAQELKEQAQKAKRIIVVESSQGQLARLVKEAIYGIATPMEYYFRPGKGITAEEIEEYVKSVKGAQ